MKKYILYSLLITSLFSCTKTLDFDDEQLADLLVLNSIVWPDSVFKASFIKSSSILEGGSEPGQAVTNGTLDIYENDQLLAHLTSSTGGFRADGLKPKAGYRYRMVATGNGQQITAETTVPLKAEVLSVDTSIVKNPGNYLGITFNIRIKDTPGDDYYRITLMQNSLSRNTYQENDNKKTIKYNLSNYPTGYYTDDPVFKSVYNNSGEEIFDMGPENRYYIFTDDFFEGKERTIQVRKDHFYNSYDPSNPYIYGNQERIYDRFTIHVQRLSKDLFNYLKYLELYDFYHDNPISEPVPVYSNIKNGAGIFAGFNDEARFTFENIYIPFSMDTIKIEQDPYYGGGGYGYGSN
ncbi:MAG TPA: DUF4249 domain-containing protein [Prolixibacteraceae bacterium]|nr:DUF4249 domain-containing protein [Prolixibacteraceae bacterium]